MYEPGSHIVSTGALATLSGAAAAALTHCWAHARLMWRTRHGLHAALVFHQTPHDTRPVSNCLLSAARLSP